MFNSNCPTHGLVIGIDSGTFIFDCYILSHMEQNTVAPTAMEAGTEVMAAVEEGRREELIIADISTDDSYLTVPLEEAASLPAWR